MSTTLHVSPLAETLFSQVPQDSLTGVRFNDLSHTPSFQNPGFAPDTCFGL